MNNQTYKSKNLKEIHFENSRFNSVGVEVMTLSELLHRVSAKQLAQPERINFHILFFVTKGAGTHTIDFVDHAIQTGSLVSVMPGQVHQWRINPTLEGSLLIFKSSAFNSSNMVDEWPACCHFSAQIQSTLAQAIQQLQQDLHSFNPSKLDIAFIRQGLIYILLRITHAWQRLQEANTIPPLTAKLIYNLFAKELEKNFRRRLSVQDYIDKLGYSKSTLARACQSAKGRSPKIIIDRRVALEAQRMLVHSTARISEIGYHLGFTELTNFVKFFNRIVGMTPSEFRNYA